MSISEDIYIPLEYTAEERKARLIDLFSASEDVTDQEQAVERDLSGIIYDFLSATDTSSDIEMNSLVERFSDSKIPAGHTEVELYMDYLYRNVVSHSINTASPRYIGHMTAGVPYFVRPIGKVMTALNQNVVKSETSKSLTPCERQALAMIHRLVYDFPDRFYDEHIQNINSTLGIMVSGGTLANVTALWCARNSSLKSKDDFSGVEAEGLAAALDHYGYKGAVIIGSNFMHYSLGKVADILGVGMRNLIKVSSDSDNRIDLAELKQTIAECQAKELHIIALVGIAGTTDSGAIDPLPYMADIAQKENIHFHVDAAWGGPILFSRQHRQILSGIERADSVTIDGHKQMYLPIGTAMVMLRDPRLASHIEKQAKYIVRPGSIDLGRRSLEGSRAGMALFLHAALNIIGRKGYEFLIDEGIRKARYMASVIKTRTEFELMAEPQMNILIYRYIPLPLREKAARRELTESDNKEISQVNKQIQKLQRKAGKSFVSRTMIETTRYGEAISIVVLRAVIANPLTTESDIDAVLDEQSDTAVTLLYA
jgi:putative pyridoxal-dependent aspartate 1-decarboxylase